MDFKGLSRGRKYFSTNPNLLCIYQEEIFMTKLNGTVAVVTGGGRGIGREIALHQAQGGAKVAVLARTAREIEETALLIADSGGAAVAIPVDLVDRLAVEEAFARV